MNEPRTPWHPSREELERILDELRPIVAEFAREGPRRRARRSNRALRGVRHQDRVRPGHVPGAACAALLDPTVRRNLRTRSCRPSPRHVEAVDVERVAERAPQVRLVWRLVGRHTRERTHLSP